MLPPSYICIVGDDDSSDDNSYSYSDGGDDDNGDYDIGTMYVSI
jgi:hypothetical protein